MWSLRTWATASNERAIANARTATTACSRRRVEREEVALFLAAHHGTPGGGDDGHTPAAASGHPGWTAARSH